MDLIIQQSCLVFGIDQIRVGPEMITQNVVCRSCLQLFQKYVGTESKIQWAIVLEKSTLAWLVKHTTHFTKTDGYY